MCDSENCQHNKQHENVRVHRPNAYVRKQHTHAHGYAYANPHRFSLGEFFSQRSTRFYQIGGGLLLLVAMSFFAPAVLIALGILAVNSILELHKALTVGMPVDLEILTVGVAFLAASGFVIVAAIVAIVGPGLAEFCRGHMCTGTWFRPWALLAIIPVAQITGLSFWGLVAAVVVGVIANYIRVFLTASNSNPVTSAISRFTQLLFAVHLITYVV